MRADDPYIATGHEDGSIEFTCPSSTCRMTVALPPVTLPSYDEERIEWAKNIMIEHAKSHEGK